MPSYFLGAIGSSSLLPGRVTEDEWRDMRRLGLQGGEGRGGEDKGRKERWAGTGAREGGAGREGSGGRQAAGS
jgi:hypothetical protein